MDYPIGGISLPERVACMTRWAESTKIVSDSALIRHEPSKFVSVTNTVFVDLVVTDCMGTTSSVDTVAVAYECNGIAE